MERIQNVDAAAGADARPRPAELADRPDPLLHARVRHEESARALRNPAMDRDPGLEAGAGRRGHPELRRRHHPVSAGARSAAADALQPVAQERHRRHQRQQRQCRRQRPEPRRARLRHPRHRHGADAGGHGQHRRHPAQRNADLRARPRQAEAEQPGAPRHPRQGRPATTPSRAPSCCCAAKIRRACWRACTPRCGAQRRGSRPTTCRSCPISIAPTWSMPPSTRSRTRFSRASASSSSCSSCSSAARAAR